MNLFLANVRSFEIEVETENCLVVISDPILRVVTYQILSKDSQIFVASC